VLILLAKKLSKVVRACRNYTTCKSWRVFTETQCNLVERCFRLYSEDERESSSGVAKIFRGAKLVNNGGAEGQKQGTMIKGLEATREWRRAHSPVPSLQNFIISFDICEFRRAFWELGRLPSEENIFHDLEK